MKINNIVNYPIDFIAEICRELKYEEFNTDVINFVKKTKVGRIHITLNTAKKPRKVRTKICIHHDMYGDGKNDHYTTVYDGTAKRAWQELEAKIYEKKVGGV
jgi:protein involved in ribonucleotide reduction